MKILNNPPKNTWFSLIKRPVNNQIELSENVENILKMVKETGDSALFELTKKYQQATLQSLQVSEKEINEASLKINSALKKAILLAKNNIETFHQSQLKNEGVIETAKGVSCWRENRAIEKVGIYIPGGTAPLFSTVLMLGIPAKIANCHEIILCSPCNENGKINDAILYTAQLIGITKIYKIGGAQAVAAMAYGTESIPKVYKIFGPGNQYVTKAKELIQQDGIAIDMPAGPSEVLIIADETGNPKFIAADLLSQAEHGIDSQVIFLATDKNVMETTIAQLKIQLNELPRVDIAKKSLKNSKFILFDSLQSCFDFSNHYAPEHLILAVENAQNYTEKITNAGSVFLGNYSCESAGDYASGTNHTLPTNGFAKNFSGVSVDSFVKKITFQNLSKKGLQNIGPSIELMAEAEGLFAHKNAVTIRLKSF
ncbi:MAG: histidinol dehydrogenase [Lutibacter sp.]